MDGQDYAEKSARMERLVEELAVAIAGIDAKIRELIDNAPDLKRQHELLCSVDGVGERTAMKMIVETNGFRDFDNARKFCCHAGVAPYPAPQLNASGGRLSVHSLARP